MWVPPSRAPASRPRRPSCPSRRARRPPLSANATATGTITATIGPRLSSAAGFTGWKPETDARAADYTFASNAAGTVPLDRLSDNITRTSQYVEH
jgi:hypothetical protein